MKTTSQGKGHRHGNYVKMKDWLLNTKKAEIPEAVHVDWFHILFISFASFLHRILYCIFASLIVFLG